MNLTNKKTTFNKYIVGVTGGIGSGKTSVTNAFAKLGIDIVDTDILARAALAANSPLLTQVVDYFGSSFLQEDNSLNRAKLRQEVFNNPKSKAWLESLIHPWVKQQSLIELAASSSPYVILVSPLLIESGQLNLVNCLLVVDINPQLQIERTSKRDKSSPELVAKIMEQQLARSERLAYADDLLDNSQDLAYLTQEVASLHKKYLAQAKQFNLTR